MSEPRTGKQIDTEKLSEIKKWEAELFINTYNRQPDSNLLLVDGKGCRLRDETGREYLDFLGGLAVNALGHGHPRIVRAISDQAAALMHTSNLYYTVPQVELARLLIANSPGDRLFLANSGAEANEAAIKLARRHAWRNYGSDRYEIITAHNSFHGRTLATVTATGQPKYHEGFAPLVPGFRYAHFNDLQSFAAAVSDQTCAIIIEVVQGEGGVYEATPSFLRGLRRLCDDHDLLLICDEVQCGMGRTGRLWAFEHYGVQPDIFTAAKALGGGLPIGAMITTDHLAAALTPGSHASTFGGNPVACAAAVAVLRTLLDDNLLARVEIMGRYLRRGLEALRQQYPALISEIRGRGLIIGIELAIGAADRIRRGMQARGVLVNAIGARIIRLLPPYIISEADADTFLAALEAELRAQRADN